MTDTLDRIIYGKSTAADSSTLDVLALSDGLTEEDAARWHAYVSLDPQPQPNKRASQTLGLFSGAGREFVLVTAYNEEGGRTIYEYVLLPRKVLNQAAGNLHPLTALVTELPIETDFTAGTMLAPLETPLIQPWAFEARLERFQALLNGYGQGHIAPVLRLLAAALDSRQLLICAPNLSTSQRILLVEGLMALLPACARPDLTFATHLNTAQDSPARVIFASADLDTGRWMVDASIPAVLDQSLMEQPYIAMLHQLWQEDSEAFMRALAALEPLAEKILPPRDLNAGLTALAEQVALNARVEAGETIDAARAKAVLESDVPLSDSLELRYAEQLLTHTLDLRDTEAALLVARQMDSNPKLNEALSALLDEALENQPDAVYVFARARLSDSVEPDAGWLERLHSAALVSLQVAINDADGETIVNWLRLIAREPDSYGLAEILHDGILAAQERTHDDPDLARNLLSLAIKHDPNSVVELLNDEALLEALPNNLGAVLRDHEGDPLRLLEARGPETFLIAMVRSADAAASDNFGPEILDQIWKIFTSSSKIDLPAQFQPAQLLDKLINDGLSWLPQDSQRHLLHLTLVDSRDELFQRLAANLASIAQFETFLANALHESQRSVDDIITLVNQLVANEVIDQQAAVDIYVAILDAREWRQVTMPLVEHLARLVQQNQALDIDQDTIWRLLDIAMTARSETVARLGAQQIMNDIELLGAEVDGEADAADTDADVVSYMGQLQHYLHWSQHSHQYVLKRWRDFVRAQPLVRLTHLEKALEGKKPLAEVRSVVQSTLAFRRMLNNRSLEEFASSVNTVYAILADIAESFDPTPRHNSSFDDDTIRAELDAHQDELSDHEWRILAKNLKELASLIGEMGDNRSKSGLVRQNVDRSLLSGEQQPESAVDTLKWMAGYLDGSQGRNGDAEE